ncbi:MAG: tetratricopeptide repeat protein [Pseudolabrys sp.]
MIPREIARGWNEGMVVGWASVGDFYERARPVLRTEICAVLARALLAWATLTVLLLLALPASAETVKGDVRVSVDRGYARLVFRLDEQVEAKVHLSGTVLVIDFKKPVDLSVDRINAVAPDFVSAARRDPDGMAIRMALVRAYRINTTPAAERLFVDILPMEWQGVLPGLPQDVIDELSRRTREAERQLRQARLFGKKRTQDTTLVKVGTQPTFTRYVFDLPNFANVVPERSEDKLTLNFDQPIRYDLSDAKSAMPSSLSSVDADIEHDSVAVTFVFKGAPDVRLFREDRTVVVDIDNGSAPSEAEKMTENGLVETGRDGTVRAPILSAPETVPSDAKPDMKANAKADMKADSKADADNAKRPTALPPGSSTAEAPASADDLPGQPVTPGDMSGSGEGDGGPANGPIKKQPSTVRMKLTTPDGKSNAAAIVEDAARAMARDRGLVAPPQKTDPPASEPSSADQEKPDAKNSTINGNDPPRAAATAPPLAAPASPAMGSERPAEMQPAPRQADAMPMQAPAAAPAPKSAAAPPPAAAVPPAAGQAVMSEARSDRGPEAGSAAKAVGHEPAAVTLTTSGDAVRLRFPFSAATPAAAFRRADTLWLVFSNDDPLDLSALRSGNQRVLRQVAVDKAGPGETVIRLKLERPRLATLTADGHNWNLVIGDAAAEPVAPLTIARSLSATGLTTMTIPFVKPAKIHRLTDPDIGDKLVVVTALGPARGILKPQNFVELRALASAHGVVVQPIADDLMAELMPDKIVISRPGGLTLSSSTFAGKQSPMMRAVTFDPQTWGFDRQAQFYPRQAELIASAAGVAEGRRRDARLDLARFYLARDLITEAKAVIDVVLADEPVNTDDVRGVVMKAIANVMLDRPAEALKDLSRPIVGDQQDAPLWRAVALAKQGRWSDAREAFKDSEALLGAMPIELQRIVMLSALRTYIATRDFAAASKVVNDFEAVGSSRDIATELAVQVGRLDEALGKKDEALTQYRAASEGSDRRSAAQGRLRELALRYRSDEIKRADMIGELEKLTATWRGDETEAEGLQMLAHFYTEDARYRDAFHVMRVALLAHPNSDLTRRIHDEAAATFDSLFLGGKGDALPPIEALGLFYDYRDLTPVGRRGDEMIRRLAERLVAVDLLGQAAELLDYQVTHRLQGAARAQVATRLAVVYLMSRKADRALATLRTTRVSGLATDLRTQRLLLEARALSDIGRHELAIEVISSLKGQEVIRLRSDVYWAAKRWREAAEQIELLYAERWKGFAPLSETERGDILRGALGYALAEDAIGLTAFREKYAAKMADGPSRQAFDVITAKGRSINDPEFREAASAVAAQNTLGAFLDLIKARGPDPSAKQEPPPAPPVPPGLPGMAPPNQPRVDAPQTTPANTRADRAADPAPTGSIAREARGAILPPRPPRGVKLGNVPPPPSGVPRLPSVAQ